MKLKGTFFYSVFVCAVIGTLFYFYQKKTATLHKKIVVKFDTLFSEKCKNEVLSFVKEQEKITTSPDVWVELFNDQFPFIEKITLSFSEKRMLIQLKSYALSSFVNQKFVLIESGDLVSSDYFLKDAILSLQAITLPEKDKESLYVSDECKTFLAYGNKVLDRSYDLDWKDSNHIEYRIKKHISSAEQYKDLNLYKNIKIITTAHEPLNTKMEQQCCHIVQDIMKQPCNSKKKWSIDMRFKNQIIVAMI